MAASSPLRHPLGDAWELVAAHASRAKGGALTADVVLQNGHPVYFAAATLNDPAALALFANAAHLKAAGGETTPPSVAALVEALTVLAAHALIALEVGPEPKATQAGELAALATDAELWHAPDGKAYASLRVGEHTEHWPVNGKGFRDWLAHRFYKEQGRVPGSQALQDALTTLSGQARFEGQEHQVHVRVAAHDGRLYLDLGNPAWEAVCIDPALPNGWAVVTAPPVRFRRPRGQAAMPTPVPGGDLTTLRPFLNLGDEDGRDDDLYTLAVAWLLAALRPTGPYPLLALHGEQGSGKSTFARVLCALVDPNLTPLRTGPRDERDLAVAANNRHVVAFDNLSDLRDWLSDALCRLATGGGFGTRELYSDDEEAIFNLLRPALLNGIEDLATRPDLGERTIALTLPTIPDTQRRDEATFWREFEAARPAILGALLTAAAGALAALPAITLARKPRMADFALWATAAESSLGWQPGTFLAAYERNRATGHEAALEASVVGALLKTIADDLPTGEIWEGTAADLLAKLAGMVDERTTKQKGWPQTARAVAGLVRRCAPVLRSLGVTVDYRRDGAKGGRRLITISKNGVANHRHDRHNRQEPQRSKAERMTVGHDGHTSNRYGAGQPSWAAPNGGAGYDGHDGHDGGSPGNSYEEAVAVNCARCGMGGWWRAGETWHCPTCARIVAGLPLEAWQRDPLAATEVDR